MHVIFLCVMGSSCIRGHAADYTTTCPSWRMIIVREVHKSDFSQFFSNKINADLL